MPTTDLTPPLPDGALQGITTTLRQQDLINSILHNHRTCLADTLSRQTATLVSALGRRDAALLVAFGAAVLPRELQKSIRRGARMDAYFRAGFYAQAMAGRRRPSRVPMPDVRSLHARQRQFNVLAGRVAWDLESRVWGGNLICLRGKEASERDGLYVAVLRGLEVVVLADQAMRERRGRRLRQEDLVRLFAALDGSPFGKGCVPWKQDIKEARDRIRRAAANTTSAPEEQAICYPGCRCREFMSDTEMIVPLLIVAPSLPPSPVECRCCPYGIHHEAGIQVIGANGGRSPGS